MENLKIQKEYLDHSNSYVKNFRTKYASHFLAKWIPIIQQVITYGSILDWGDIISSNLDMQLSKVQKEHQFYMSSYLLDVMCASREYPSLGWKWKPYLPSIHVYYKILWQNKYKGDYERIFNDLFSTIYRILFGEEAPCLSPEGQKIVKAYGHRYMTYYGVYIRILASTKDPHWFPNFVLDTLLLQKIAYQAYVNGVDASFHKDKKGLWPHFPLSMGVHRIENFKQAKEEVGIFSSLTFKQVTFRRHDPQGKLKEHLQQAGFTWSYAHEDLLPRELSQKQVLFKSKILTLDQMIQIDKESERQKSKIEKNKDATEQNIPPRVEDYEEGSSSSSMPMYNLDYDGEDSEFPSNQSPTIVLHDAPLLMHMEEVHNSPITEKVPSERHFVVR